MATPNENNETDRINKVYQQYYQSAAVCGRWSQANAGNQAILKQRTGVLGQILGGNGLLPLEGHRILDIGCGDGGVLASFTQWGAMANNLYGVELRPESIVLARQKYPDCHFRQANAEQLDFAPEYFDLVLLFTVFSSILNEQMRLNIAEEVQRVLKPGGAVLWYDFRYNNPYNQNVRGITQQTIQACFPDFGLSLCKLTVLPPLARRLGRTTPWLYPLLSAIPVLQTHYAGLLVKPHKTSANLLDNDAVILH
jgi:ubiquinone/menaquinone biosynthesis C-methylase UbiE